MAARLRLCLVSESFYPEVLQGLQIHAYQLMEKLLDLGVECEVLARPVRPETPSEQRAGRILVRHLGPHDAWHFARDGGQSDGAPVGDGGHRRAGR